MDEPVTTVWIHAGEYLWSTSGRRDSVVRYLVVMTQQYLAWCEGTEFAALHSRFSASPRLFSAVAWSDIQFVETRIQQLGLKRTVRIHVSGTGEKERVFEFDALYLYNWINAFRSRGIEVVNLESKHSPGWRTFLKHNLWPMWFCIFGLLVILSLLAAIVVDRKNALRDWLVAVAALGALNMVVYIWALTRTDTKPGLRRDEHDGGGS